MPGLYKSHRKHQNFVMPTNPTWIQTFNSDFVRTFRGKQFVRFQDGEGYSLVDDYPGWYKKQMGIDDNVQLRPLFRFIFYANRSIEDGRYVPLIVEVSQTSEINENGIIKYMLNDSRVKRLKPVDVDTRDDFYIDTHTGKLVEKRKHKYTPVSIKNIYDRLFKIHISNWRTPKGALTRFKIFFTRRLLSFLSKSLAFIFSFSFLYIKGKRYKYDVIRERYLSSPGDSENRITTSGPPPSDIDFFGYKVSVWTLFTYSFAVVVLYLFFMPTVNDFLLKSEPFSTILTIAIAILSIVIYDKILPKALEIGVKYGETFSYDLKYTGIKIRI